jgi:hypothetical protein
MQLRPGTRLESSACDGQVIVVRAPAGVDVDLRCGGVPMRELGTAGSRVPITAVGDPGVLLGKRYADEELGLEVLCTHSGAGALTLTDQPIPFKAAKPLPASD